MTLSFTPPMVSKRWELQDLLKHFGALVDGELAALPDIKDAGESRELIIC